MAAERCTVDGTVNSLIFQNEDNGYTVLRLDTTDGEQITVVGCIPCAAPGEELIITGEWKHHPTHGVQIQAETVERYMPRSESGILNYLSSGAVKGVGPATAQLLVQRFGDETLDVLELEPERMTLLKGITARKAQEIAASFRAQAGMRRLMEFLAESGLSAALAVKLCKRFGDQASEAVRANPYLLCDEFFGVSFGGSDCPLRRRRGRQRCARGSGGAVYPAAQLWQWPCISPAAQADGGHRCHAGSVGGLCGAGR